MNRAELVQRLAASHDLTKAGADRILDDVFGSIVAAVKKHGSIRFVGFGSFTAVKRAARKSRNPLTGKAVKVPARTVPKFVPGSAFKAVLDPKSAAKKAQAAAAKKPAVRKAGAKMPGRVAAR